jgi:hypothetical protein
MYFFLGGRGGTTFSLESPRGLGDVLTIPHLKNLQSYEIYHKECDVDWSFGRTQTVQK